MRRNAKVTEIARSVGNNLKACRQAKGLTQKELAERLGKRQPDYSDYERGKVQLDYEKIVFICKELDISPEDLFDGLF